MKHFMLAIISMLIVGVVPAQELVKPSEAVSRVEINTPYIQSQALYQDKSLTDVRASNKYRVAFTLKAKTRELKPQPAKLSAIKHEEVLLTPLHDISPNVRPRIQIAPPPVERKTWATPKQNLYVKGKILIQLKPQAREKVNIGFENGYATFGISALNNLNARYKVQKISRVLKELPREAQDFNLDLIYLVQVPEELDLEQVADEYRKSDDVKEASPNYVPFKYTVKSPSLNLPSRYPDDPYLDWSDLIIKGPECWTIETGNPIYEICVLDNEAFDPTRPDMDLNAGHVGGAPGTGWHGHACASVACAELSNDMGISGLAGGWDINPGVTWSGYVFTDAADNINAVMWAANNGVTVITQSVGYSSNPAGLENAFNYASAHNAVCCVAAPNNHSSEPGWPAYYSSVIACGGCDPEGKLWDWGNGVGSNYGEYIEIIGPADTQYVDTITGVPGQGGYTNDYAGNSFAAPAVGAAAALMKSEYPVLTAAQIRERLIRTANYSDHDNPSYAGLMGAGIVNLYEAVQCFDTNVSVNEIFDVPSAPEEYTSVYPRALVQNRGINPATFSVIARADSMGVIVYADTVQVTALPPNNEHEQHAEIVSFKRWMPVSGTYVFKVFTKLLGDQNVMNDTLSMTVAVLPPDLDTLKIDSGRRAWYGANGSSGEAEAVKIQVAQPCTVIAILYYPMNPDTLLNWRLWGDDGAGAPGTLLRSGSVRPNMGGGWYKVNITPFYITSGYLFPGWTDVATPWYFNAYDDTLADPPYNWWYNGSSWVLDDYFDGDFMIRLVVRLPGKLLNDISATAILEPSAHVIPGYQSKPQAIISNVGKTTSLFPVFFKIDSLGSSIYSERINVSGLLPDTHDTLTFASWTPNWDGGTYSAILAVQADDQNPHNDTIQMSLFCSDTDTLCYDNGVAHNSAGDSIYLAVRYCVSDCQFHDSIDIAGILYYLNVRKDASAPEYVPDTLYVWDADSEDVPGTELHKGIHTPTGTGLGWHYYSISPPIHHGARDFWIGAWQPGFVGSSGSDTTHQYVMLDAETALSRSRLSHNGTQWLSVSGDNMLRPVIVHQGAQFSHDVVTIQITEPPLIVSTLDQYAPRAKIKNVGANTESFNAIARITESGGPQVYTQTVNVSNLEPGEMREVAFPDPKWQPQDVYTYYDMAVYTALSGDTNFSNDTIAQDSMYSTPDWLIRYDDGIAGQSLIPARNVYVIQRFTADKTGGLRGCWVAMHSDTNPWPQCSLFLWKDDDGWYDGGLPDTFDLLASEAITLAPGDTGSYWFYIQFPFPWVVVDTLSDFFIGFWNPPSPRILPDSATTVWRAFWTDDRDDSVWNSVGNDLLLQAVIRRSYPGFGEPYVFATKNPAGDSVVLYWNRDSVGDTTAVESYKIYSDTNPAYIPSSEDFVFSSPDTFALEPLAPLYSDTNRFYFVFATNQYANLTSGKSNMGYVFNKFVNENPATTDRNWVSLPWHSPYASVSDVALDLSPVGEPLTKITNLRNDNMYESWLWDPDFGEWYGTDFAITPGRGYEMVTMSDDTLVLVGSNDAGGLVSLNENPTTTDRNWVSIPYNHAYYSVSDITAEYSPVGNPLTKVTNLRNDNMYESWLWDPDFGEWYGTDFAIERGRGYEMVTVVDTTWNPTEFSNEAQRTRFAHARRADFFVSMGAREKSDRTPLWMLRESKEKRAQSDARAYVPLQKTSVVRETSQGTAVSHTVRVHFDAQELDGIVFTAYRPEKPYDVLTEQMIGCGIACKHERGTIWFDVGNFREAWSGGEEVLLIIEASRQGQNYFAVHSFELNADEDIQEIETSELIPIPMPARAKGRVQWARSNNKNIIGYSVYHENERLNNEIISGTDYAMDKDVTLRPVIRGGFETVYTSGGTQGRTSAHVPIAYAFAITPNPFKKNVSVEYAIPHRTLVEVGIYDVTGRKVKNLISDWHEPGYYRESWRGEDNLGRVIPSGVYFIRIETPEYTANKQVIFVH